MFEALKVDPCRVIEALLDVRSLRRVWHKWRHSGTHAIIDELSARTPYREEQIPTGLNGPLEVTDSTVSVLVIDAKIPLYDQDAGARSSFLYLKILRDLGLTVYFMPNDLLRREPHASTLEALGVCLLVGSSFGCGRWKKWLDDQHGKVTHVILHRPNVAKRYLKRLKLPGGPKIIYFAHDLRYMRDTRQFQFTRNNLHKSEARYWERVEKRIVEQTDRTYFFSDVETQLVSSWPGGKRARTIALFPSAPLTTDRKDFSERSGLLFVGGFSHQPNCDAVLWFAENVFPLIRKKLPQIRWHVVGQGATPELLRHEGNGIVFEGAVSDERLEALYQSTRIAIAPLRFGAGVKGKIIEAMRSGLPVVTTEVGAEGIPNANETLRVCDSPDGLAENIVELHESHDEWSRVSAQSRNEFDRQHSRNAALALLKSDLNAT